jgi:hypothetical protein
MRKGPAVADEDLLELVTIQYPPTGETMERPRGSLLGFTEYGWVVLDAAGRKKAVQPTTDSKGV